MLQFMINPSITSSPSQSGAKKSQSAGKGLDKKGKAGEKGKKPGRTTDRRLGQKLLREGN
jgi:hypothetical protein